MKFLLLMLVAVYSFGKLYLENTPPLSYSLDPEKSVVEWSGASPKVSHQGSFAVTCTSLEVTDGQLKGGTFVIPIASIKNFDLPKALKPVLLKHLKSKDFLNLALYPEAIFKITQITSLSPTAEGSALEATAQVTGDFTLLGNTHAITFPAKIDIHEDTLLVDASFKLDRTKWGMDYAADPALENRHIYPEVAIHVQLAGTKN
ncbi:YceI family protein [Adhaeribacter pallidiroseus]|uniref:Lipid/polyisoprenoid-binding YceI-like domain-containing protein n=1 Tax=Adhaeribacter pallidiroseus TaxID=2072847 RepID=A0A369QIH7_9BACT|nr:YceI family protein [Adhaeribacter pallidiroseus]RDC64212.1 hypothetical protein AHMF7616_02824 [Adhaeribacter pallidiroseus]